MGVDITAALITTLIGMIGVVIGAIANNYVNSKISIKNSRRDILFKKKLEYFENLIQCIEKNTKLYLNSLREFEKKPTRSAVEKINKKLKKQRVKFDAKTSPLYLDTRFFSPKIKEFVNTEKKIFSLFEKAQKKEDNRKEEIEKIREKIKILIRQGNDFITLMRRNLEENL